MNSQQHKSLPQGYTPLPEEVPTFPNASEGIDQQQQQHFVSIPQGTPVIVQGIPIMSLPAHHRAEPMQNFEVSQPNLSELHKPEPCWVSLYKLWLVLLMFYHVVTLLMEIFGEEEQKYNPKVPGMLFLNYLLSVWAFLIYCQTLIAIERKSLKKIKRAIDQMTYYLIPFGIFWIVESLRILDPKLSNSNCQNQFGLCATSGLLFAIIQLGIMFGSFIGFVMVPAIKYRNLLIRADMR